MEVEIAREYWPNGTLAYIWFYKSGISYGMGQHWHQDGSRNLIIQYGKENQNGIRIDFKY